jgi:hypothetical protein
MRTFKSVLCVLALCAVPAAYTSARPAPRVAPSISDDQQTADVLNQITDKIVARETAEMASFRQYSPLVETYIQNMKNDKNNGWVPAGDTYFMGRSELAKGVDVEPLAEDGNVRKGIKGSMKNVFSFGVQFLPAGFLQMIYLDENGFDKTNYKFDYVRREFLGDIRCLVFDVTPSAGKNMKNRFVGRIWVEDQQYTIVRFNGALAGGTRSHQYFHFDSWRTNTGPGLWLPSFIYSEENNSQYNLVGAESFKAQTRLWGYNLGHSKQEQELSKIMVESSAPINDSSATNNDVSPLQAQRSWDRQAEDNVVDRLERLGLLAPVGSVDKALEIVVNNIEVGNNLDIQPEIRCRVLLTSTLESFSVGHTIIMSRGLIDVLPDEASYAAMLSQEMAHIVLGHKVDTQFAFFDRVLQFDEKKTFEHFGFARTKEEDEAAQTKAAELLKGSIYKDQLKSAELFMGELQLRSKEIPNLISPKLGNNVLARPAVAAASNTNPTPNQIVALPLGGRVKMDPWDDKLEMLKTKSVGNIAEREKMPFEVTPFMPYLTRETSGNPPQAINAQVKQDQDKKINQQDKQQ